MKVALVFVAFLAAVWGVPQTNQPSKVNWEDFPMKRMYVDDNGVVVDSTLSPGVGSRILNGHEVEPHSIPSQAWLILRLFPGSSGWSCGGTLITKTFVLTAAHCVVGAGLAEVYLGAHDRTVEEPGRIILVATKLIAHPNYNSGTISNDVGLIDLEQEVKLSEFINVIKLPSRRYLGQLFEGANSRVSGWGLTSGGGSLSNVLLAVNSTVLGNAVCRSVISIFEESEICISGEGGVGSCNGDSGGPLIYGDVEIGIVSYGFSGCPPGSPSVFARVTSFLEWIASNSDYVIED
ncbi:chymotrypsin-like [Anoplophora glabripennis]|uniref:chymotrypsin-like n=1 Tax=Anoplophora glabripennis TaxID=217634 RepID=UPI000C774B34|nr:chymotrypsin-like [Anoplophora glabripennis]